MVFENGIGFACSILIGDPIRRSLRFDLRLILLQGAKPEVPVVNIRVPQPDDRPLCREFHFKDL